MNAEQEHPFIPEVLHPFLRLGEAVSITDEKHIFLAVNKEFTRLTGYRSKQVIGQKASLLRSTMTPRYVYQTMYHRLKEQGSFSGVMTNRRPSGELYSVNLGITKFTIQERVFYVGIFWALDHLMRGMYLSNDQLENWRRRILMQLAYVAESSDPNIVDHIHQVEHYTLTLSHVWLRKHPMFASEQWLKSMGIAAMLHDVGKAHIPSSLLYKPGKLNTTEFALVKQHVVYGEEMLREIELEGILAPDEQLNENVFQLAKEIARAHHEWWNGTGYPDGLRGEEIPLSARIVAVADVLDALRSQRPYKLPWADHEIQSYFLARKEVQFDPELVDLLMENWSLFRPLEDAQRNYRNVD
ncbi:HD-GYP domain-containing protein [Sulfoacidibacillus thermotolerans]|uniref:HD-GYP domain-containing protein n=1 Tax=Sulfoacidibacillus thermotolerans TaxID=1765684 RepID=A0A2U3DA50_SULT2|nr:HD domain-containing phosphohydrolase [Sulfoacidibacillus thermotolerans]PWI58159.1 hypothetical protein BM613_04265 [Sulfoacidibacillus thermotolerans]